MRVCDRQTEVICVRLCRKISLLVRSYSGPALIGSSMQEQCRAIRDVLFQGRVKFGRSEYERTTSLTTSHESNEFALGQSAFSAVKEEYLNKLILSFSILFFLHDRCKTVSSLV